MPATTPTGRRNASDPGPPPEARLRVLCAEARVLAYRRCRAEAASRRLKGPHAPRRAALLATCSDRLLVAFHRALDRVMAANGFDEALSIFRDYRAELNRRMSH